MSDERLITGQATSGEESAYERAIRPKRLTDYTGQTAVCEQMNILISAARQRE